MECMGYNVLNLVFELTPLLWQAYASTEWTGGVQFCFCFSRRVPWWSQPNHPALGCSWIQVRTFSRCPWAWIGSLMSPGMPFDQGCLEMWLPGWIEMQGGAALCGIIFVTIIQQDAAPQHQCQCIPTSLCSSFFLQKAPHTHTHLVAPSKPIWQYYIHGMY